MEDGGEADAGQEDADYGGPVVYFGVGGPCDGVSVVSVSWVVICFCVCLLRRGGQGEGGLHPNTKSPIANKTPPIIMGGSLASGTDRFPFALNFTK